MIEELPAMAVVVPTYRRPGQLRDCLASLSAQLSPKDELVVVHRQEDVASAEVMADFPRAVAVEVTVPGVVRAMDAGARSTTASVVAFTDDDAIPSPTWLAQLREHFRDGAVGGVGGRDRVWFRSAVLTSDLDLAVGQVSSWGAHQGNHHLGKGAARRVDVLKGVNMAWRRSALAFPRGLAGHGAEAHNEMGIAAWARRRGFTIVYDPTILVDHYPGERFDQDGRIHRTARAAADEAYNLSLTTQAFGHTNRLRVTLRGILIGEASTPGLARSIAGRLGIAAPAGHLIASVRGRLKASVAPRLTFRPLEDKPSIVVLAHDVHARGGMERCLLEQISRLREQFSLRVVSATMEPRIHGVEYIRVRLPARPFLAKFGLYYWLAPLMARISRDDMVVSVGALSGRRPDVVLLHYLHSSYSGPRGSSTSDSGLGPRRAYAAVLHRLFVALERSQYGSGSPCVVAVSPGLAEEVRTEYAAADVRVVSNGVDDTYFRPSAKQGEALRKQLGVPSGEFVVAFVGGDWRRKGLDLCIRALGRLHGRDGGTMHLVVAGHGDTDAFQRLARAEGVEHLVHFVGQVETSAGIYALADVLLLPSGYETFSMVAHEAAASGVPVIGTEVHGVREIIQAGGGVLVTRDADDIAGALERLARDPAHAAELGKAAQAYAHEFTWEGSARGLAEVLASVTRRVRPAKA